MKDKRIHLVNTFTVNKWVYELMTRMYHVLPYIKSSNKHVIKKFHHSCQKI